MQVRAKFVCQSIKKYKSSSYVDGKWVPGFNYEYEFTAVTGESTPENKAFFASTPNGRIQMSCVRDDLFVPGECYYLDFSPSAE